ncbi:MAG: PD-(D/E)XK nuclease family protein [Bacteroidia bacterium]
MTFLEIMVQQLKDEYGDAISDICIVVPTRRAVVFLRETLAKTYQKTLWAPRMVSIQDIIRELSGWQFPDILPLVYELYQVYSQVMKKHHPAWSEPFEVFYSWGEMLVKDFDELDKYEVDAEKLFTNIRDLKEIDAFFHLPEENMASIRQFWFTVRGQEGGVTEIQEKFLMIWQVLYEVYSRYRQTLFAKGLAYDGMAYREISSRLAKGELSFPWSKIVFVGFNALSTAEEKIFKGLLDAEKAIVYWDVDLAYFPKEETLTKTKYHKFLAGDAPGKFIRDYHGKWLDKESRIIVSDMQSTPKDIFVSGVPLQVGQARYLGNLLNEANIPKEKMSRNAIVLADENLLFPVLYSIPAHISPLNITMGFPLKQTNIFHLLMMVGRMLRNMRETPEGYQFAYQEVLDILNNPFIKAKEPHLSNHIRDEISKKNLVYVPLHILSSFDLPALLKHIFSPPKDASGQIAFYETIFGLLLEDTQANKDALDTEYVFHLYTQFNLLKEVMLAYGASYTFAGFSGLFREVLQKAKIPFEGEPLVGVQLMGFLETRVLDFENIYILAANEGNLPDTTTGNSFIPFSLRKGFGLPTFEEKDTIYAYHFYRLIQRAKTVHLIYNSVVNESGGAKELSRYIRQIRHFFRNNENLRIQEQVISTPVPYYETPPISISAGADTSGRLKERFRFDKNKPTARPYFSATGLTSYLGCSLRFYFRYVAEIREPEEIEQTMEANTLGKVVHTTMELLYGSYKNQVITPETIKILEDRLEECMEEAFVMQGLGSGKKLQGKNYLLRNVIRKICERVLAQDRISEPFEVISLEEDKAFFQTLEVDGEEYKFNGMFDRVDYLPEKNIVRIVDYKTGKVEMKAVTDLDETFDSDKYKEIFQGYLYAWMYNRIYPEAQVQVGYYTAKHMSDGIQMLNGGKVVSEPERIAFEQKLKSLVKDILTRDFIQTEDVQKCSYCPYKGICNRGI